MAFLKFKLSCKQALKLALMGAGAFLFLTLSVKAFELNRENAPKTASFQQSASRTNTLHLLRATTQRLRPNLGAVDHCHRQRRWATVAMKNYKVYICGKPTPRTYIGVAKNGSGGITLPISISSGK